VTGHFPIVFEREASGAISAYVAGLPVYAATDTHRKAEHAIAALLTEYVKAHPDSRPDVQVRVARVTTRTATRVDMVGVAAAGGSETESFKGTGVASEWSTWWPSAKDCPGTPQQVGSLIQCA
jgi:hypothetical protein